MIVKLPSGGTVEFPEHPPRGCESTIMAMTDVQKMADRWPLYEQLAEFFLGKERCAEITRADDWTVVCLAAAKHADAMYEKAAPFIQGAIGDSS